MPSGRRAASAALPVALNDHCCRIARDGRAAPLVRLPEFRTPTTKS
jgi:hypothetical protein